MESFVTWGSEPRGVFEFGDSSATVSHDTPYSDDVYNHTEFLSQKGLTVLMISSRAEDGVIWLM